MILAFTGHRLGKLGGYRKDNPVVAHIAKQIARRLLELEPEKCISGMALGVDQIAAEICIALRIPFIAAVPCKDQEKYWPEESQKHYHWLLERAAEVAYVSRSFYTNSCMQARNIWMVENSDALLAVWDGTAGGTKNCIDYAKGQGRTIYYIPVKKVDRA